MRCGRKNLGEDELAIVVTAYQPDPNVWMEYKRRRGK